MKVTMRDIAKHANTSVASVSYVLNNKKNSRISDATRERILKSVEELHYTPDVSATRFKSGISKMIGFIGPAVDSFFWSTIVERMEHVLADNGYNLIITNARENPEKEINDVKQLSSGLVDGLILESTLHDCKVLDNILPSKFPVVFIDRSLANCCHDAVFISNYTCMYEGVNRLINIGHTKIGYIAGLKHLSTTVERLRAYRDAVHDNDINCDDYVLFETLNDFALGDVLQDLISRGCTAIIVSNSRMTYLASIWLKTHQCENKIALFGYHDDTEDLCNIASVGLISQPAAILGQKAAELMIHRIKSPDSPANVLSLHSELHWFV